MASYVEITSATLALLPDPCAPCLWWQTAEKGPAGSVEADEDAKRAWMRSLEQGWGSLGLALLEGTDVHAAIQFAPVGSLPRLATFAGVPLPEESVLLFCLRGRVGRSSREAEELLQHAMLHLRRHHVRFAHAFARPLGSRSLCGVRNLFGLEFLEAHGFTVVRSVGDAYLVQADLRGLIPTVAEAGWTVKRLLAPNGQPSPAALNRT